MTLTNEDLLAISKLLDTKLDGRFKVLEDELQSVKEDVQNLKDDMQGVKADIQGLKEDVQSLKQELHEVKLFQENVILPRLNTIESCYMDTFDRYRNYADKMDDAFADIAMLKKVVSEHSNNYGNKHNNVVKL